MARKGGKFSKYDQLQSSVSCEWNSSGGGWCGATFSDIPRFLSHVRGHCNPPDESLPIFCGWNGCDFTTAEHEVFCQHVILHPYHTFLKLLGAEFQSKYHLPPCQIDEQYKNVVPSLPFPLKCFWNSGQCMALFENVQEYFHHLRQHVSSEEKHCCKWKGCTFEGKCKSKLVEHCRSHTCEKVIACPGCGGAFASNAKFKDHLVRQANSTRSPFSCSICFRTYPSERLLREHVRRHINTLKCPHCDLTCNGPSRLQHHIKFRHSTEASQQCPICQKCFKTIHCLGQHIETHNEKFFKCSIHGCKYVTKTLKSLQTHVKKVHMPEQKQYSCHICSACFFEGLQLSTHLKEVHEFSLPPGHSRFRYVTGLDGYKRLQTIRLDADSIVFPSSRDGERNLQS